MGFRIDTGGYGPEEGRRFTAVLGARSAELVTDGEFIAELSFLLLRTRNAGTLRIEARST